jgi:hypothetical protein
MSWVWVERIEGAVFFLFALWIYAAMGASWFLFALLILAPDIAMLGYLIDTKWGARIYNLAHTYTLPLLLGVVGYLTNEIYVMVVPVIWIAHIAADRALGYGLKLPSGFRDTHLGRIGSNGAV